MLYKNIPLTHLSVLCLGMDTDVRLGLQDQLIDVIMWVLVSHPELHYYQVVTNNIISLR